MNDKEYFVVYANYPIIDNHQKHLSFLKSYSLCDVWGTRREIRLDENLILDSDEIERQRNSLFNEILTQITAGTSFFKIVGFQKIIEEVNQYRPAVRYGLSKDTKGNEILTRNEYGIPDFKVPHGSNLFVLACHSLISFLSVKGNRRRIKQCPYCKLFFIAKDAKRKICYKPICKNKYHRDDMRKRREDDVDYR